MQKKLKTGIESKHAAQWDVDTTSNTFEYLTVKESAMAGMTCKALLNMDRGHTHYINNLDKSVSDPRVKQALAGENYKFVYYAFPQCRKSHVWFDDKPWTNYMVARSFDLLDYSSQRRVGGIPNTRTKEAFLTAIGLGMFDLEYQANLMLVMTVDGESFIAGLKRFNRCRDLLPILYNLPAALAPGHNYVTWMAMLLKGGLLVLAYEQGFITAEDMLNPDYLFILQQVCLYSDTILTNLAALEVGRIRVLLLRYAVAARGNWMWGFPGQLNQFDDVSVARFFSGFMDPVVLPQM